MLDLPVAVLAGVAEHHAARAIDQVDAGPVAVLPGPPRLVAVVDRDWIVDREASQCGAHRVDVALEGELGRMDADDHEPLGGIARVPADQIRQCAYAVDASVGEEVD